MLKAMQELEASFDQMDRQLEEKEKIAAGLTKLFETLFLPASQNYADILFEKINQHTINTSIEFYSKNFTNSELKEILNFEKSPIAKKRRNLQGEMARDNAVVIAKLAGDGINQYLEDLKKNMESGEFNKMLKEIVKTDSQGKTTK